LARGAEKELGLNAGHLDGEALAAISDGLAQLHMRFYGRGPARTKTHLVDDLVVCVLWEGFTTVERTLLARGETGAVEAFRRTFQSTMEPQFIEVVEAATGRRVGAYMSQVHVDPDLALELFVLDPEGAQPASE
jgi:uncharacterized protein YbcI